MVICGCSISVGFLAFQKTFDTVDYVILLEKLEHCALGESLINGLHLILLIDINLCQLMSLNWLCRHYIWGTSGFYIGFFTLSSLYK